MIEYQLSQMSLICYISMGLNVLAIICLVYITIFRFRKRKDTPKIETDETLNSSFKDKTQKSKDITDDNMYMSD